MQTLSAQQREVHHFVDLNTDGHPVYMMNTKNGLLNPEQI